MNPAMPQIATIRKTKQKPRYWNEEEDALLKEAIEEHGTDGYHTWKEVAKHVPNRSYRECMQRWTKVLAPGLKKGKWSSEEDDLLISLVSKQLETLGEGNGKRIVWNKVAQGFKGRSCKQCRERWINHLDPSVKKTEWTQEEDLMLLQYYDTMPNKWAKIARQIPGRTENMVKVRWNALNRQAKKRKQTSMYYAPPQSLNFPHLNAAQNYNQFYINNQISLNLNNPNNPQNPNHNMPGPGNSTHASIPRIPPNEDVRKNSLYMFPGGADYHSSVPFQHFPMPQHPAGPPPKLEDGKAKDENGRKLSLALNGFAPPKGLVGVDLRHNSLYMKQGFRDDFPALRRSSSLAHLQKMADAQGGERRLSFTINGFNVEDQGGNVNVSGMEADGNPGRRLSSFLYQDLVKNMNQVPGVNLPNVPGVPPQVVDPTDTHDKSKRARVEISTAQQN